MKKIVLIAFLVALLAIPVLARAPPGPSLPPVLRLDITNLEQNQILNTNNVSVYFTNTSPIDTVFCKLDQNSSCNDNYIDTIIEYEGGPTWQVDPNGQPVSFKNLPDGKHTLWVWANYSGDSYYLCVAKASVDIIIDMNPELNLAINDPINGTNFNQSWVDVNFTTSSTDVNRFEYKIDTGSWQNTGIDPDGPRLYTYNFSMLSSGIHNLWIRAISFNGTIVEGVTTVLISADDNMPPEITIHKPPGVSCDANNCDYVDQIQFTVTDDKSWQLYCDYYNGTDWYETDTDPTSGILYTQSIIPITAEGEYQFGIYCEDENSLWDEKTVDITIDTTAPTTYLMGAPGRIDGYYFVNGTIYNGTAYTNNPTLYFIANDVSGIDHFEAKLDDGSWIEIGTVSQYTFNAPEGTHTLRIRAVDRLGNVGLEVNTVVTVDTTPLGSCYTFSPGLNDSNYSSNSISFQYWSDDPDKWYFMVKRDNLDWIYKAQNLSHPFYDMTEGRHDFYVRCYDYAGNIREATVYANIHPYNPPSVIIDTPAQGSNYTADDILVQFHSDNDDIESFQYSYDNSTWHNTGINAIPSTIYDWTFTNVPEGTSKLYIRGVDNQSYKGIADSVTVNVESIFTNLHVEVWAPDEAISYTDFPVTIIVWNDNEELIPVGDVMFNLSLEYCSMPYWEETERWAWELEPYGGSDYTTWSEVSCAMEELHTIKGELIYIPTGQKKTDTVVVNVVPYGNPKPGNPLNRINPGKLMKQLDSVIKANTLLVIF